jgi:hypothetical protein
MDLVKLPILNPATPVGNAIRQMEDWACAAVVVGEPKNAMLYTARDLVSGQRKFGDVNLEAIPGAVWLPPVPGDVSTNIQEWSSDTLRHVQNLFTAPEINYSLIWPRSSGGVAFVVSENARLADVLSKFVRICSCTGNPSHPFLLDELPPNRICQYDNCPIPAC